jgi:hypothetical protein
MKKRNLFLCGVGFAFVLAWAWFAKPLTMKKRFYMAGVHITSEGFLRHWSKSTYRYSTKLGNEPTITDLLSQAGYQDVTATLPRSWPQAKHFERRTGILFWKKVNSISLTRNRDSLLISASPDL